MQGGLFLLARESANFRRGPRLFLALSTEVEYVRREGQMGDGGHTSPFPVPHWLINHRQPWPERAISCAQLGKQGATNPLRKGQAVCLCNLV